MPNIRLLKNARSDLKYINNNELYKFSLNHTLSIYSLDAICSFIPKNACSSLRYSVALANGFIKSIEDIKWIHKNNQTFKSTQRELALANFTFVVLRCPYRRVASSFLNKIVDRKLNFNNKDGASIKVNFSEFLQIIKSQNRSERDEHWRNQTDFLHYEEYDEYYSIETFKEAVNSLNKKGFDVIDTRNQLNHDLSKLEKIDGEFSFVKQNEIQKMKEDGYVPSYKSLFGVSEIDLVREIYRDDIELYSSKFGDKNLLFK
tara:strand:- start:1513 stop:2292 length:780 start_codon:yes stop_codon:yes gene_type:complete